MVVKLFFTLFFLLPGFIAVNRLNEQGTRSTVNYLKTTETITGQVNHVIAIDS